MKTVSKNILKKIKSPKKKSHKGQNGRLLVVAGSNKYHGALLLTIEAAARIVDMVYVHTVPRNMRLVNRLRSKVATFIAVSGSEVWETVELSDVIAIGPGLEENDNVRQFTERLLREYPKKRTIVDATALWHVDPKLLHKNCILTPHSREFEQVFKLKATPRNVQKAAKRFGGIVLLTGPTDYISDGKHIYKNTTGNPGMTKGGTGDVLVGLIAALATNHTLLTSTLLGAYINGMAGDALAVKKGTFYNAKDLIDQIGEYFNRVWSLQEKLRIN